MDEFNRISIEVASMIVAELEELDLSPQPYSHITETSNDKVVLTRHPAEYLTWVVLTRTSRENICNARLAFRKLYDASWKSFAKLIGDRRFRLTTIGMTDLKEVARMHTLAPHIRTLTFGLAGYRKPDNKPDTKLLDWALNQLAPCDRPRVQHALVERQKMLLGNQRTLVDDIKAKFRALPNVENIRFVIVDEPLPHLAGWFRPTEESNAHQFLHSVSRYHIISDNLEVYQYTLQFAHYCIMEALKMCDIELKDLRYSWGNRNASVKFKPIPRLVSSLRILRLSVGPGRFDHYEKGESSSRGCEFLAEATGLEDISLILADRGRAKTHHPSFEILIKRRDMSFRFCKALHNHQRLRRIEFSERWAFTESELVSFIARHSQSLRVLIFRYPYLLSGTWLSTLQAIAKSTENKLQFLSILEPFEIHNDRLIYVTIPRGQLPKFTYPVELNFPSPDRWFSLR